MIAKEKLESWYEDRFPMKKGEEKKCEVCKEEISESVEDGICDKCAMEQSEYEWQVLLDSRGQY